MDQNKSEMAGDIFVGVLGLLLGLGLFIGGLPPAAASAGGLYLIFRPSPASRRYRPE